MALVWRLSTHPEEDPHTITKGFLRSGHLSLCDGCSAHYNEDTYHVMLGLHPVWPSTQEEHMMGDTSYTEKQVAFMKRVAPLIDEALLAMEEHKGAFLIEEVHQELRSVFEEKKSSFYAPMGYQAWNSCIRGRLNALGFDLAQQASGSVAWVRSEAVKNA